LVSGQARKITDYGGVILRGAFILLLGSLVTSVYAIEQTNAPSSKHFFLEVAYQTETDKLSIAALNAPLLEIIRELSEQAPLTIRTQTDEILTDTLSLNVNNLALDDALRKIFADYSFTAINTFPKELANVRTTSVILLGRESPFEGNESTSEPAVRRSALFGEVRTGESPVANSLIEESEKRAAKEATVEYLTQSMSATLDDGSANPAQYFETLDQLIGLDPGPALENLMEVIENPNGSQRIRVLAAQGLGRIGDQAAGQALARALGGSDPLVSQAAANSLAQIGGESTTGALLQAFEAPDPALNQAAAIAIGMHGNGEAKRALNQIIQAQGMVPETVPGDVMQELNRGD